MPSSDSTQGEQPTWTVGSSNITWICFVVVLDERALISNRHGVGSLAQKYAHIYHFFFVLLKTSLTAFRPLKINAEEPLKTVETQLVRETTIM